MNDPDSLSWLGWCEWTREELEALFPRTSWDEVMGARLCDGAWYVMWIRYDADWASDTCGYFGALSSHNRRVLRAGAKRRGLL